MKAAFVFSFAKFVDWPADALNPSQPFVICVVADGAVGGSLAQIVKDRKLYGHDLQIQQRPPDGSTFRGCHVAFIGNRQARRGLNEIRGAPVLTIGDGEEFARRGGMIAFVLEKGRVRFVMNPTAAERARLKVSSRLLALARIVQEEKGL